MDPKSSAKSKRSHSQHGRKSHPTPSAPGSHKNKKPTQTKDAEQGGDHKPKPPRPRPPSLPSNWDRYEEEYEFEGEQRESLAAESKENVEAGGDAVVVKSKGADYRYLLEQARSQTQNESLWNAAETESPAANIAVPDYLGGLGSMLLARGKGLFLSYADDNFIVDDTTTSNLEIPFLSLDLNALEAQLAKLKASERLFIEPEYIPEEMELETGANLDETRNKSSSALPGSGAMEGSSATRDNFTPEPCAYSAWSNKEKDTTHIPISRDEASVSDAHGNTSPSSESHYSSAAIKKSLSSDAASAKSEIDALLDSLGEIGLSGSLGMGGQLGTKSSTSLDSSPRTDNPSFMNCAIKSSDVDDTLDDLFSESQHFVPSYNPEVKGDIRASREEVFAEADGVSTRIFPDASSFDDSIDDLLADTSSFSIQKSSTLSTVATQHNVESGAFTMSDTLSKALDDLDSLLDL